MATINPFLTPDLSTVGVDPTLAKTISDATTKQGTTAALAGLAFGQDLPQAYGSGIGAANRTQSLYLDQLYRNQLAQNRGKPFADIQAMNYTPESVKAFQASKTPTGVYDYSLLQKAIDPFVAATDTNEIAFSMYDKPFRNLTTDERQKVLTKQQMYKRDLQVASAGETSFLRESGKLEAEYQGNMINKAMPEARRNVTELQNVMRLIKEGDVNTGIGAELKTNIDRVVNYFKKDPALLDRISDTELLNSALGRDVFKAIGQLGIGARGIDTPAERDFLRDVLTGRIQLTKQTLVDMTQNRIDRELAAINRYNRELTDGRYNRYQKEFNVKLEPVKIDMGASQPTKVIRYGYDKEGNLVQR